MNMAVRVDPVYKRAEWLGYGRMWPRYTLMNAGGWTPQQNREYQAAFDAQEHAIRTAQELETPDQYKARKQWHSTVVPQTSEDVFDKYLPITNLEATIQFQEGLIQGFQLCRDRPESMLEMALKEVAVLKEQYRKRIEAYWCEYPQHLVRHGKHVFVKGMAQYKTVPESDENPKKDGPDGSLPETTVDTETHQYWLQHNNLTWGIDCIAE